MATINLLASTAVLQYLFFGAMTGRARRLSGLQAPAISGHAGFERMYRVQMNTLELLIAFLPALLLAATYWPTWPVAALGTAYIVGRFAYWRAYVRDPARRGLGFMLSMLPTVLLALMALVGALSTLAGWKT